MEATFDTQSGRRSCPVIRLNKLTVLVDLDGKPVIRRLTRDNVELKTREQQIQELMSYGFGPIACRLALQKRHWITDLALEYLIMSGRDLPEDERFPKYAAYQRARMAAYERRNKQKARMGLMSFLRKFGLVT